jgi:hypothetical protein
MWEFMFQFGFSVKGQHWSFAAAGMCCFLLGLWSHQPVSDVFFNICSTFAALFCHVVRGWRHNTIEPEFEYYFGKRSIDSA